MELICSIVLVIGVLSVQVFLITVGIRGLVQYLGEDRAWKGQTMGVLFWCVLMMSLGVSCAVSIMGFSLKWLCYWLGSISATVGVGVGQLGTWLSTEDRKIQQSFNRRQWIGEALVGLGFLLAYLPQWLE